MYYVDTSALVKFVVREEFSADLREWAEARDEALVSSELARTELLRAVQRVSPSLMATANAVIEAIALITPAPTTFQAAGRLSPIGLRSLDAIHVATALELGDELSGLVAYDDRLLAAAEANGIAALSPGRDPV